MTEVCFCCKTISGRRSYFKPKRHYLVLASGASDQDVCGVFGCNFSWRFQRHHRRPWPTSAAGDNRRFIPFNFLLSLAAPHLHGVLVLVTDIKFICHPPALIVHPMSLSPAIKFSPVSLSPAINCSPVSTTPAIGSNGILGGLGDTHSWKKPEVENLVSDSL